MPDNTNHGMQCDEFDALLMDAIDGVLKGAELDRFQAHAGSCPACGPLFAEIGAGRSWLKGLTEVEPPVSLVGNILASTTGVDTQRLRAPMRTVQPRTSWLERLQASLEPIWAAVRQPRFAMSFGMAFFTLSVGLTVLGIKPGDISKIPVRPSEIRRTYYTTKASVVRRYNNIRLVYEWEARVREFKRNMEPAEPKAKPENKNDKNDTTQQPEQKQERNYSQTDNHLILAGAPLGPSVSDMPVVSVTTYRRFV